MTRVRFRHHSGLAIAGLVAFFGAIPVASYRWYLAPILLVPAAVAIWGWRAGTDADEHGLTVRALVGRRRDTADGTSLANGDQLVRPGQSASSNEPAGTTGGTVVD